MSPHRVSPEEQGRALAVALDLRLRHEEFKEREVLFERPHPAAPVVSPQTAEPQGSDLLLRRLEAENQLLRDFHAAVLRSRSWRTLQFFRGLIGRQW